MASGNVDRLFFLFVECCHSVCKFEMQLRRTTKIFMGADAKRTSPVIKTFSGMHSNGSLEVKTCSLSPITAQISANNKFYLDI